MSVTLQYIKQMTGIPLKRLQHYCNTGKIESKIVEKSKGVKVRVIKEKEAERFILENYGFFTASEWLKRPILVSQMNKIQREYHDRK